MQTSRQERQIAPGRGDRLHAYRSGICQRSHRHEEPHISLILAGTLREESDGQEFAAGPGMFALRASGFRHQVRFGERGALIISASVDWPTLKECKRSSEGGWACAPEELVRAMLAARQASDAVGEFLLDVVAYLPGSAEARAPSWLGRARDRLTEEAIGIDELAREAGVHRVHFSRAFTRTFGMPPSIYRRRMAALRAASAAIDGRRGLDSAYECGFADQSHMARALKRTTGMSYGELLQFRSKVTSVQA